MAAAILVSAPGKIILTGDHAVVYGHAALVAPLQRRTYVYVTGSDDVELTMDQIAVRERWSLDEIRLVCDEISGQDCDPRGSENWAQLHQSTRGFLTLYASLAAKKGIRGMSVSVKSNLVLGAGLGSSASYSVCLSAALLIAFGQISEINATTLDEINAHAFTMETIFHGKPSGADNTTCCYGSVRRYVNKPSNHGDQRVSETIDNFELDACVVNTGVTRSTRALVSKVRQQYDQHTDLIKPILDAIGAISEKFYQLLQQIASNPEENAGHYEQLSELTNYNQKLLETLRVSHGEIERVCGEFGLYGLRAKLTGAGGGGCVYALIPPGYGRLAELTNSLTEAGFTGHFTCKLGGAGVRREDPSSWQTLQ